jgi:isocitrate dehydrogenase
MMLVHIDQPDVAERVHNAWLRTIEDGIHTYDIYEEGVSRQKVGTREFAQAVVARLGQWPEKLKPASYASAPKQTLAPARTTRAAVKKDLVGVDVFIHWDQGTPEHLGRKLEAVAGDLSLGMISNRGVKVYPDGFPETSTVDHWRCRFLSADGRSAVTHAQIIGLLQRVVGAGLDVIKTENLYWFDGERGYSLGQGE